jgi:hypothetical protein
MRSCTRPPASASSRYPSETSQVVDDQGGQFRGGDGLLVLAGLARVRVRAHEDLGAPHDNATEARDVRQRFLDHVIDLDRVGGHQDLAAAAAGHGQRDAVQVHAVKTPDVEVAHAQAAVLQSQQMTTDQVRQLWRIQLRTPAQVDEHGQEHRPGGQDRQACRAVPVHQNGYPTEKCHTAEGSL